MNHSLRNFKILCGVSLLTIALSGCTAVVLGGAAVGANAVADRRSAGAMSDDNIMEMRVYNQGIQELKRRYAQTGSIGGAPELSVVSYNRRILLLGQVANESDRAYVESLARHESNATDVYNHIQLTTVPRTANYVANDTWITSKLRSRLLNVSGVYPGHVKVVTFNSVVYVMGILTQEQQAAVTNVISTTPGVQQVVTLYENYVPNPIAQY